MNELTIKEISVLLQSDEMDDFVIDKFKNDGRSGVRKLLIRYYKEKEKKQKEYLRLQDLKKYELIARDSGYNVIAGIDEAGRGPLAGPVVAAAVVLPLDVDIYGINDSKKIPKLKRNELFLRIQEEAISIGVGIIDVGTIDKINIHQASLRAMLKAISKLYLDPDYLLVDGFAIPDTEIPQKPLIGGDSLSFSIAAASIVAKVTRDEIMVNLDKKYPHYGFARHKGYGTADHREAIKRYGPCPEHRRSFFLG